MTATPEKQSTPRDDGPEPGLRAIRLVVTDARSPSVRAEVARQSALLRPESESEALEWIEAVSEFDETR